MTTGSNTLGLDAQNPWPGLDAFEESAASYFHGREREADSLLLRVLDSPVTVLYGRSGLGKTSLLQAALFPRLRELRYLPISVRLDLESTARPLMEQVRDSVRTTIEAEAPDATLPSSPESLWEYLHRTDVKIWSARNYLLTPVVVIDQFEELFTLGQQVPGLTTQFRNDFGDLAENRIPATLSARPEPATAASLAYRWRNYKLLISLREDFLPDLEGWSQLIPTLTQSRVRLLPMAVDAAVEAVYLPGRSLMTQAQAELIVDFIAGARDRGDGRGPLDDPGLRRGTPTKQVEPALLSLFCHELNEERRRRDEETFSNELIEGAKRDVLKDYYASCVHDRPHVAQFIEDELITQKGYRNSYAKDDALQEHLTEEDLAYLIGKRLVRIEERYGTPRVELTHDVLTEVVRDSRDQRKAEEATTALKKQLVRATDEAVAAHRRLTRARLVTTAMALLLVVVCVLTYVAVRNADRAEAAKQLAWSRQVGSAADQLVATRPDTAVLAGLQSLRFAPDTAASPTAGLVTGLARMTHGSTLVSGHTNAVRGAAISPNGALLATGGDDRTVRLWDTATGQPHGAPLTGHTGTVWKVAFSPDNRLLVSGGGDQTVRLWDTATGQPHGAPLTAHTGWVWGVAFSPDGRLVASASGDGTVRLWDTATGQPRGEPLIGHTDAVVDVAFSPDGRLVASASGDRTIRLWDTATGQPHGPVLTGHTDVAWGVAFSPDGRLLASAGRDRTVRLWDVETGRPRGAPLTGHADAVIGVAFSPDGRLLASASDDRTVRLWTTATGAPYGLPITGHTDSVQDVTFSRDGRFVATASVDRTARVWSTTDTYSVSRPLTGHSASVNDVAFSPDGRFLASSSTDGTVRLWENPTGPFTEASTGRAYGSPLVGHTGQVNHLAFSPDSALLASSGDDGTVRLWDVPAGEPDGPPISGHAGWVRELAFSPGGELLATVGGDETVRLWDVETGQPHGSPLTGHTGWVWGLAFSPNDDLLASAASDETVRLWDVETGQPHGSPLTGHTGAVWAVAFSRDGKLLASAGDDGTVRLWDVETGQPHGPPLLGHTDVVRGVAFSPDGRLLASAGGDQTVRLWNVNTGQPYGYALTGHTGPVWSVSFSPDGGMLASASKDQTVRLWNYAFTDWFGVGCRLVNRNLSQAEWNQVAYGLPYESTCPPG